MIYAYEDMKYIERFPSEWDKCVEQSCKDFITAINNVVKVV